MKAPEAEEDQAPEADSEVAPKSPCEPLLLTTAATAMPTEVRAVRPEGAASAPAYLADAADTAMVPVTLWACGSLTDSSGVRVRQAAS